MKKDTLFAAVRNPVEPFEFNETVVSVFDDMIRRSVPGYREILLRQGQLAASFYRPDTHVYDLGCSNGNFGLRFSAEMGESAFEMIAVDSSEPMLAACRKHLPHLPARHRIRLVNSDIRRIGIENASVVVINFTLQFLPPADRDELISRIHTGLIPGGVLLLSEKIIHRSPGLNRLQQEYYYRFKKENGYSELEISQKRDALENVLIPETIESHQRRLEQAGFDQIDIWHKWFNFAAMIAVKKSEI